MSNQDREFTDELISAYLDGELSDQDRERVEQVIESEPRYRRMLEELQTLRESIHALPRYQLDQAFHERVMERALDQSGETSPSLGSNGQTRRIWPHVVWASLALAAGVLVMLFLPGQLWRDPHGLEPSGMGSLASSDHDQDAKHPNSPADSLLESSQPTDGVNKSAVNLFSGKSVVPDTDVKATDRSLRARTSSQSSFEATPQEWDRAELSRQSAGETVRENRGARASGQSLGRDTQTQTTEPIDAIVYFTQGPDQRTQHDELRHDSLATEPTRAGAAITPQWPTAGRHGRAKPAQVDSNSELLIVKGSPEQVATSLVRISQRFTQASQDVRRHQPTARSRFREEPSENQPDLFSPIAEAERERLAETQASDLYLDLDAPGADSAEIETVTSRSEEHQQILRLLSVHEAPAAAVDFALGESAATAKSSSDDAGASPLSLSIPAEGDAAKFADSTPTDENAPPSAAGQPVPAVARDVTDNERRSLGQTRRPAKQEPASRGLGRSQATELADSRELAEKPMRLHYWLEGRGSSSAAARHYSMHAPSTAESNAADARSIVDELRRIHSRDDQRPLRVLFVMPDAAVAAPQPTTADESR